MRRYWPFSKDYDPARVNALCQNPIISAVGQAAMVVYFAIVFVPVGIVQLAACAAIYREGNSVKRWEKPPL